MDVRKKLAELIREISHDKKLYLYDLCDMFEGSEKITDLLIENGVTVQKWIPVDERLPKNFISVLGYMTDAGEFPPVRECYTVGNAFFFPSLGDVHPVSHWCEMPEPPKGE